MYKEIIEFNFDFPLSYDTWQIGKYHLHCHEGVIEILMVLEGTAHVKSSFEEFDLSEGDYVVIRELDPHSFSATSSHCILVSLYIRMDDYIKKIPHIKDVYFACESFDLAKYRNESAMLRRLIASIIHNLATHTDIAIKNAKQTAESLLWTLAHDYDMVSYYSRNWNISYTKIATYYRIMHHITTHYAMKNLPEYISKEEHYSKSYILHIFKEMGGFSFRDMVDFIRISKSESMLLTSNIPIATISDLLGYSDVKYYIKNFKKWFHITPANYRKKFQTEVNTQSFYINLEDELLLQKLECFLHNSNENKEYRAAITPISLKILSSGDTLKLNGNISSEQITQVTKQQLTRMESHPILLPLIDKQTKFEFQNSIMQIKTLQTSGFVPIFAADLREISCAKCKALISEYISAFLNEEDIHPKFLIIYKDISQLSAVEKLVTEIKERYQKEQTNLIPLFIP